jgi:hypothetical protein
MIFGPPFPLLALGFGLMALLMMISEKKYFYIPAVIGGLLNGLALIVNGGIMPVQGPKFTLDAAHTVMTSSSHLKFLCDIFSIPHVGIASIGDLTFFFGTLLTIAGMTWYSKIRKVGNEA